MDLQGQTSEQPPTAVHGDPAISHWLDFFHRYHGTQDIRPVALSMQPELVAISETQASRYVFEVGVRPGDDGDEWMLIAWEIDVPGIRIRNCDSREEAMEWFERREIYGPKVATVRLRPDVRPW